MATYFVRVSSLMFLFCLVSDVSSDDLEKCQQTNKCRCIFANGTGIDLSNLAINDFYKATLIDTRLGSNFIISNYYFHPCSDVLFKAEPQDVNVPNSCGNVAICQRYVEYKNTDKGIIISYDSNFTTTGYTNKSSLSNSGHTFFLFYPYEANTLRVNLVCVEDAVNQLTVVNNDPKDRILTLYSKEACVRRLEPEHHRSLGTTLLIIFFVLLALYLILGVCTRKFLMGAQGIEVLPNLSFWTDLPGLIKDGVQFIKNGFKVIPAGVSDPGKNPNPHSYDSI